MRLPNGTISELTSSESVVRRVVNIDETNHLFNIYVDRSGTRSIDYGCDKDSRKDRRGTKGYRFTTGVYTKYRR